MKVSPYACGLELGGVRVLELCQEGATQADTLYTIEFTCCGRVAQMTHSRIRDRIRDDQWRCGDCRKAGVLRESHRVIAGVRIETGPMRGFWPSLGRLGMRGA